MIQACTILLVCLLVLSSSSSRTVMAFTTPMPLPQQLQPQHQRTAVSSSSKLFAANGSGGNGGMGNLERLEFRIYPDGRVEETVRGVKGGNCHKLTEGINELLGKVVASEPTEEMYEQEIVIDQTLTQSIGTDSSSNGWEGSSSW